jgi:GAF domain-containing protein
MDNSLKSLLQLSSELVYVKDIRTAISKLSMAARTMLEVKICSIFLHDEATEELWSFEMQEAKEEIRFPDDAGIAGHVFQAKESLIILDPYQDSRFNPEVDRTTGFKTEGLIALPLVNRKGDTFGVVEAVNKLNGKQFTDNDLDLLNHLGLYMSALLENNILNEKLKQTQEAIVQKLSRASRFKDRGNLLSHRAGGPLRFVYRSDYLPLPRSTGDAFFGCPLARYRQGGYSRRDSQ